MSCFSYKAHLKLKCNHSIHTYFDTHMLKFHLKTYSVVQFITLNISYLEMLLLLKHTESYLLLGWPKSSFWFPATTYAKSEWTFWPTQYFLILIAITIIIKKTLKDKMKYICKNICKVLRTVPGIVNNKCFNFIFFNCARLWNGQKEVYHLSCQSTL